MQPFDQRQGFEVVRLDMIETCLTFSWLDRLYDGLHHDTSPVVVFIDLFDETFVPPDSLNLRGRFEDQLK